MTMADLDFESFWDLLEGPDADNSPVWIHDRQPRARRTREAILRTAYELLQSRPYVEVTLRAIAEETGVSVGAVYDRFPSKEAILTVLGLVTFSGTTRKFEAALNVLPDEAGLEDVIDAYVGTLVDELHRHSVLIQVIRARAGEVPELRALLQRTNQRVHEAFLARARKSTADLPGAAAEPRLRFGLFLANAAAREAILSGALGVYGLPLRLPELKGEISDVFAGYLRIK
jgi:AcrR family transcriptional regulator